METEAQERRRMIAMLSLILGGIVVGFILLFFVAFVGL